ncbi:MAG: trehalose-6-phosphate synthase [Gammaproteobacteria bacterium]
MHDSPDTPRLLVVSNRLPFVVNRGTDGRCEAAPASGGLITALLPVLRARGGSWIGWHGATVDTPGLEECLDRAGQDCGFDVTAVALSEEEVQKFYMGFSNEIVWPLFHDMPSYCNFEASYWNSYLAVNRRFARTIAEQAAPDDLVWVHDYHLMNVASELRRAGVQSRTAFFLHVPFPPPDLFMKMPWRQSILAALAEFDLVGFQTRRDRRNFLQCVRALLKDSSVSGQGQVLDLRVGSRQMRVGHFPIGVDFAGYARGAAAAEVEQRAASLRAQLQNCELVLGVDRLDYSKGIPLRLLAFQDLLHRHPELRHRVTLIQVVVPSRENIPSYHQLRTQIEQLVSRINGEFSEPGGWIPIHYVFRSLETTDLLAYYRAAGIGLVTPLKDGMNLVAKEYCTCSIEEDCVLILSEFAGAAAQLRNGALLVNPFDIEGTADALHRAIAMPAEERRRRMGRMRRQIQRRDVFWWVDSFLRAATSAPASSAPAVVADDDPSSMGAARRLSAISRFAARA